MLDKRKAEEQQEGRGAGFRFFISDSLVLAAAVVGTWWLWRWVELFALFVPFVVGHFFLFCNVFRVRRRLELIWAVLFVLNTAVCLELSGGVWWAPLAAQLPVSVAVIGLEIRSPRYHGIFWNRWR